jgi:hypothetical protein
VLLQLHKKLLQNITKGLGLGQVLWVQYFTLVKTGMNLQVPKKCGEFLDQLSDY